jgi:hypothetical protein
MKAGGSTVVFGRLFEPICTRACMYVYVYVYVYIYIYIYIPHVYAGKVTVMFGRWFRPPM